MLMSAELCLQLKLKTREIRNFMSENNNTIITIKKITAFINKRKINEPHLNATHLITTVGSIKWL